MSQIKLKHSGGNGVIIAAPTSNPAADRTLLLPSDGDSTIDTLRRAGNILQVVFLQKTDDFTTSNDDQFNDITGMSAAITPTSSSSKILVTASLTYNVSNNSNIIFRLLRGSTPLGNYTGSISVVATGIAGCKIDGNRPSPTTFQFLDSPSTTDLTTYKLQEYHNAGTFILNSINASGGFSGTSTITLMEVAA